MLGSRPVQIAMGILTIVVAVGGAVLTLLDGDPLTNPDMPAVIAAITAGIGLLNARPNKVTSEEAHAPAAGAPPPRMRQTEPLNLDREARR